MVSGTFVLRLRPLSLKAMRSREDETFPMNSAQLAHRAGVSVRTLRHYHQIGFSPNQSSTGKRLSRLREPRLDSRVPDQTTLCAGNSAEQHDRIGGRRHQRGRITRRTRPRTRIRDTPLESSQAHDFSCTLPTVRRPRCTRKLSRVAPDRCGPEHLLPTVKEHSPLEGAVLLRRRREQSGEQWTKT